MRRRRLLTEQDVVMVAEAGYRMGRGQMPDDAYDAPGLLEVVVEFGQRGLPPSVEVVHTDLERMIITLSVEVMRAFTSLEESEGVSHPSHRRDVADAVHDVQRVLAMRLARRVDPEAWGERRTE